MNIWQDVKIDKEAFGEKNWDCLKLIAEGYITHEIWCADTMIYYLWFMTYECQFRLFKRVKIKWYENEKGENIVENKSWICQISFNLKVQQSF